MRRRCTSELKVFGVLWLRTFQDVTGKLLLLSSKTSCVWITVSRRRRWYPGRKSLFQSIMLLLRRTLINIYVPLVAVTLALFITNFFRLFRLLVGFVIARPMYEAACIQRFASIAVFSGLLV
jgi:hypothetical protein